MKKTLFTLFTVINLVLLYCPAALALTEDEAAAAVDAQGKDAVSGNLFLWLLCAIAGHCKNSRCSRQCKKHTKQHFCGRAFRYGEPSCAAKYRKFHQRAVWWHWGFFRWGHVS